jgi:hypothetical protein
LEKPSHLARVFYYLPRMKFPSVQNLIDGFLAVVRRFPLELIVTISGTLCAMLLIERDFDESDNLLLTLVLCSNLGLVLFLSVTLLSESRNLPLKSHLLLKGLGLAALVLIYFLLDPITDETNTFRFGFLLVGFHLLVSFAPFISRGSVEGFWEYNKQLFLRILTATLYSSVLYGGLAIALIATDALFDFKIRSEIYGHLFALVFGVFNTTFFLAGVPANWTGLEESQHYPKGLKIFTQYVLIPLATVYLGILLTYEGKLILEWTLPKGLVASLVLGYAVYGILSILLVYPIRFDHGNRWITTFSRLFYLLLIPLVVLLVIAVWIRISQYGITESRYILILLSLWLIGITVYFLSSRLQNIKVIPASLFLLALFAVWGPQSAASVSVRSQLNRLASFFEERNSFKNEKLIPLANPKGSGRATEILRYIINRHGTESLQNYLLIDVDSLTQFVDTLKYRYTREYERFELVRRYLNLQFDYEHAEEVQFFSAEAIIKDSLSIDGFRYLIKVQFPNYHTDSSYVWQVQETEFTFKGKSRQVKINLQPVVDLMLKKSPETRYLILKSGELYCQDETTDNRLVIETINFQIRDGKPEIQHFNGILLIR